MDAKTKRKEEDFSKIKKLAEEFPELIEIKTSSFNPGNTLLLSLNIPTARNTRYPQEVQNKTDIKIDFPLNYPFSEPKATITTPIWNPNVYSSGLICHGTKWLPTEGLDLFVIWIMKLISYDPSIVFTGSPANREAADWYNRVKNKNYFPTINLEQRKKKEEKKVTWKNINDNQTNYSIVNCPNCNQKSRVPSGKKLKVNCPSCKHIFEVST